MQYNVIQYKYVTIKYGTIQNTILYNAMQCYTNSIQCNIAEQKVMQCSLITNTVQSKAILLQIQHT